VVVGDAAMVRAILPATAANVIDVADEKNYTALMLAERQGLKEIAGLIRERIARDEAEARFRRERRGNPTRPSAMPRPARPQRSLRSMCRRSTTAR